MLADLLEHVVEEAEACADDGMAGAIKIDLDVDIGFLGGASNFGPSFTGKEVGSNLVPILGYKRDTWILDVFLSEEDGLTTEVFGQLNIAHTVTNDEAVGKIIFRAIAFDELGKHTRSRLAVRVVVFRIVLIVILLVEINTFSMEGAKNEVVEFLEVVARVGVSTEAILI